MLEEESLIAKLTLSEALGQSDISDVLLHDIRVVFWLVLGIDLKENATDWDCLELGHEVSSISRPFVAEETLDI